MESNDAEAIIGTKIRTVERMSGGVNNPTYRIEPESGDPLIIQVIGKRFEQKAERDLLLTDQLASIGIPVARILKADTSRTQVPYDYLIKEVLPGTTLKDALIEPSMIPPLYRQIGDILDRMHANTFHAFGEISFEGEKPHVTSGSNTYREAILTEFSGWIGNAPHTPFSEYREELDRWLERAVTIFGADIQPRLTHNDFANTNIIVHDGTVSGIIDFDNVASSNSTYDLYRIHQHLNEEQTPLALSSLFETYHQPLPQRYESQIAFYLRTHCLAYIECWQAIENTYEHDALKQFTQELHAQIRSLLNTPPENI